MAQYKANMRTFRITTCFQPGRSRKTRSPGTRRRSWQRGNSRSTWEAGASMSVVWWLLEVHSGPGSAHGLMCPSGHRWTSRPVGPEGGAGRQWSSREGENVLDLQGGYRHSHWRDSTSRTSGHAPLGPRHGCCICPAVVRL